MTCSSVNQILLWYERNKTLCKTCCYGKIIIIIIIIGAVTVTPLHHTTLSLIILLEHFIICFLCRFPTSIIRQFKKISSAPLVAMVKIPVVLFLPKSKFKKFIYTHTGEKKKTLCEQTDALIMPERNLQRQDLAFRTESARREQKQKC